MRSLIGATVASLALASLSYSQDALASIKQYQIAAQPMGEALRDFAAQSAMQLIFSESEVAGATSAGVNGERTAQEALREILKGADLRFEFTENNVVVVRRPVPVAPAMKVGESTTSVDKEAQKSSFWDRFRLAAADTSPAGVKAEESTKLEEIVVTAQKREEKLSEVPISIAVVSTEEINRRGLVSSEDYLRGIPGVSQEGRLGGMQAIVIRGLETAPASQNYSAGTTVATYFGETPTSNTAGTGGDTNVDIKLVDIQRVEVLRGPQGTAFGNSSLGGAIRTIPIPPRLDRMEGSVKAMIGSTSGNGGLDNMAQGVVNIPLVTDRLALRAVGYRFENSGYYKNVAGSDPAFQAGTVAEHGAQAFASNDDEAGAQEFVGGRLSMLFQATDQWKVAVNYLNQKTESGDGVGIAGLASTGGYTQALYQVAPEHVDGGRTHGWLDTDIRIANATTEYDLGWGQLAASYSNTKSGTDYAVPLTLFGVDWAGSGGLLSSHGEDNAEVRLTTRLSGPLNFLAGVYHEKIDDDYGFSYWYFGDPATNDICGAACNGVRYFGQIDRQDWLKQTAAFGEVTWQIVDGLALTGGVRRYDFDRRIRIGLSGPLFGESVTDTQTDASGNNYRGNLSYKINPNTMVYASWAQGFRLGRPQAPLSSARCDRNNDGILDGSSGITIASTGTVTSDSVENFELGAKLSLGGRLTISADVFRIDWTDVPVRALAPGEPGSANDDGSGCGLAYNTNAGEARSEGLELQATWQVNDAFRVDVGGSYIDAHLTKDAPALGAREGDRLPGSAKVNASVGLQYEFEVQGRKAYVRTDSIYAGSFYNNFAESSDLQAGGYVKVDATGGISLGSLNVELFVRNLTNRDAFTNRDVSPGLGPFYGYRLRPRNFGLQLGYSF